MSALFEIARASFLESLRVRQYAAATVATRAQSLVMLSAFLAENGIADVREIDRGHVAAFQRWLAAKSYTDQTRLVHLATLRAFFAYLERTGTILVNPCTDLVVPRLPVQLPGGVLTRKEARRILAAPDEQSRTGLRDKAILEVFYSTGLRLSELARLTLFDVDCLHGIVRVNKGKGGKDRVVPLGSKAIGCLRAYLTQARAEWSQRNPGEHALWLGSIAPHGALKTQAIQVMVRRSGRAAGMRVTPHLWRHTCATHLVGNGAGLVVVQQLLGHASLATTQLYARVTLSEIKEAYHRAHPRSGAGRAKNRRA